MFFDIGWSEMLVIAVVAFIVIGPKELPTVLRTVAGLISKARAAGRVFQQQLDEVMREANAADLRRQVDDALRIDPNAAITQTIDPQGEINNIWDEAQAQALPDPTAESVVREFIPPGPTEAHVADAETEHKPETLPSEEKPAQGKAS
jgi:sec-independent protein translocase protein TatB